jgi:hypothetical protein
MKVFVYPEKTREELGAIRWVISWEQLKNSVPPNGEEIDFDRDIDYMFVGYSTEEKARNAAKRVLKGGKPYFGSITLQKQTVDWFVKEDGIAEWADIGQSEEIS